MQLWMDREIVNRTVVCVLSPDYVKAFEEPVNGVPRREGTRYEIRAILLKIYRHGHGVRCPVIPVGAPGFSAEDAPAALSPLVIERLDPGSGDGVDRILARIAAAAGAGGDGGTGLDRRSRFGSGRTFRQILSELAGTDPVSAEAIGLAQEAVALAAGLAQPAELLSAFPQLEKVIKVHGETGLMATLSEECLRVLGSRAFLFERESTLEADVLIFGKGWQLGREYCLEDALGETLKGIRLAEKARNRKTAAYGRVCASRIRMLLAEQLNGPDSEHELRASLADLAEARGLFGSIDEDGADGNAMGTCIGLSARAELLRYRLCGHKPMLDAAAELAADAAEVLTYDHAQDYELVIVRAEIAAARRHWADARKLLDSVVDTLELKQGAEYREVLARAHEVRAALALATPRKAKGAAMRDLGQAREIYRSQLLDYGAAACEWEMLKIDSATVTSIKITSADMLELEDLTGDPRTRLAAVQDLERRLDGWIGPRPSGRKVNWQALVNRWRFPL